MHYRIHNYLLGMLILTIPLQGAELSKHHEEKHGGILSRVRDSWKKNKELYITGAIALVSLIAVCYCVQWSHQANEQRLAIEQTIPRLQETYRHLEAEIGRRTLGWGMWGNDFMGHGHRNVIWKIDYAAVYKKLMETHPELAARLSQLYKQGNWYDTLGAINFLVTILSSTVAGLQLHDWLTQPTMKDRVKRSPA